MPNAAENQDPTGPHRGSVGGADYSREANTAPGDSRPSVPLTLERALSGGQHLTSMLRHWIGPIFARAHEMVEADPAAAHWRPEQIPLLVLAMYHIVVGYFAVAPLYKELNGLDLMTQEALDRQTDFLCVVVDALFEGKPPSGTGA